MMTLSLRHCLPLFISIGFFCAVFAKPIRLSHPEVLLTGWNARCLEHADLNNDGLEDLVYFNLDKSYLEILYRCAPGEIPKRVRPVQKNRWEPYLEDAQYVQERIFISGSITDIAIGDVDCDSRLDLVTASKESGIKIYFRDSNTTWSEPFDVESEEVRPYSLSLKVVSNNTGADLYALTEPGLERISFSEGKPIYPSTIFREDDKKAYGAELIDLNNDGFLDWMYLVQGEEFSLKVRLGQNHSFGPELSMDVSLSSFPTLMQKNNPEKQKKFCSIDSLSREALVFSFKTNSDNRNGKPFNVTSFDLFSKSNKESSWAMGDFNGDGFSDLVGVSSSEGELVLLESDSKDFTGTLGVFPSLRGISDISVHKHKGELTLLLLSADEEVLGYSRFVEGKGFLFPKLLKIKGTPIVACSTNQEESESGEVHVICENDSDFSLQTLQMSPSGKYEQIFSFELESLKRAPTSLFPCSINGDKYGDLLILSNRESPVVLLGDREHEWREVAVNSVVRKSFLNGVDSSRLSKVTTGKEKKDSLLVAGEGHVRIFRWEQDDFNVVEQYNSKDQSSELSCPVMIDWKGDGNKEIFAFDEGGHWERLVSSNGFSNQKNRWENSFLEPQKAIVLKSKSGGRILSLGSSGFQVITTSDLADLTLEFHSKHLTELPKIRHNGIESGDFNNDGIQDLVCLDGKKNLLEFLTLDQQKQSWKSVMHFEIFEKNLHYQGKKGGLYEPREGMVLDLNGDQLDDLVFLVHDRLLLYKQIGNEEK